MKYLCYVLLGIVSYFIGNILFAKIFSHVYHGDVTKSEKGTSGNPGTLNMWRKFGFLPGILTFIFDMIKGLTPTLIAYLTFGKLGCNPEIAVYIAGFCVVLGHIFPITAKFKGGKGIATSIGVFLVVNWKFALIAFVVMVVCMLFIKFASICTLGFVLACSIAELVVCNPANWVNYIFICGILTLVFVAHRGNIKRLLTGKENKTELWRMVKGIFKKKNKTQTALETQNNAAQTEQPTQALENQSTQENMADENK